MIEKVYTQIRAGDCADYAMLSVCQKIGVDVDEAYLIRKKDLTIMQVANHLMQDRHIKGIRVIESIGVIDLWLRKGHYIVAGTGKLSFDSIRTFPYLQSFLGNTAHNFCIVASSGDKWKIKDSQGPNFADDGYWYMNKSDFRFIKKFRIILN